MIRKMKAKMDDFKFMLLVFNDDIIDNPISKRLHFP